MKLDFKSSKWDKEMKQLKDFNISLKKNYTTNVESILTKFQRKQDYCWLYGCLSSEYESVAQSYYADGDEKNVIKYTYLSALALLTMKRMHEKKIETTYSNLVNKLEDIEYAVCKIISVDCYDFLQNLCEPSIMSCIMKGDVDKAKKLVDSLDDNGDELTDVYYNSPIFIKTIYSSILNKNEEVFNDRIIKRIKKYRKNMLGYSTIIDYTSVGLIKAAKFYGLNCNIDIAEIPKFFFKPIDIKELKGIQLPMYDDVIKMLQ